MTRCADPSDLARFTLLFAALYAGFGAASPFFPQFLSSRGLTPEQVGLALSLATTIRLLAAPLAGRIADRLHALRNVLSICAAMGAAFALGYLDAVDFLSLLAISLLYAAALAPTSILADALALSAARARWLLPVSSADALAASAASPSGVRGRAFEYGWVRGAGSAAFIIGSLASAQAVRILGLAAILIIQAALLLITSVGALSLREPVLPPGCEPVAGTSAAARILELLRLTSFRRLLIIAALIVGSHAMHDAFAMIGWNAAGIGVATASILWSESVAAEVVVFFGVGPFLLRHIRPESGMALAAIAAVLRWAVMAQTPNVATLAAIEPLHGLSFALLHLSCMHVLAVIVPRSIAATAQALYATLGMGAASAALTLVSGALYAHFSFGGFWVMAALALAALPVIWSLGRARAQ